MPADFRILPEAARWDRNFAVIARIWNELATPYEPDARIAELTTGQRAIYALSWIRAEVNNGGFYQCFWNSTGFLMPEAIAGSVSLGATKWTALLQEAASVFGDPYPRDRDERGLLQDALSDVALARLSEIDDEFYALDETPDESLDTYFDRYIETHPEEFFVVGPEEERAMALVELARGLMNQPFGPTTAPLRELLEKAVRRSEAGGDGTAERLAQSLIQQLGPFGLT